jgi:hypothetical protein
LDKTTLQRCFKDLVEAFNREEKNVRDHIRREIQFNECYWTGQHDVYWDSRNAAYLTPRSAFEAGITQNVDILDYDKYIATYRAHGKSIIAASSGEFPRFKFMPEDFNEPLDVLTAEIYTKIGKIIQQQNDGRRLFARAFYIRWNQHFVAIYNYNKEDLKFGTVLVESSQDVEKQVNIANCGHCGSEMDMGIGMEQMGMEGNPQMRCSECGNDSIPPETSTRTELTQESVTRKEAQRREILEVFGPKHVRIPKYARRVEDIPYLCLAQDFHKSRIISELGRLNETKAATLFDDEKLLRLPDYAGEKGDTLSVEQWWIRPWAYFTLENEIDTKVLAEIAPNGARLICIEGEPIGLIEEDLDDHWSISLSPTSDSIYDDPLGKDLIPLNQIQDELLQQTIEVIKQQIPELFADPNVLNFKAYGMVEKRPGTVSPAQARPGMSLEGGFYETHSASLSREVDIFSQNIQQLAQLVVHAFPSIFGGQLTGGTGTYAEYAKSAQQALQVLGLDYTPIVDAFAQATKKAVRSFIENVKGDKVSYSYSERGSPINLFIDKTQAVGKVGEVSIESASQIPLSWAELRAMIMDFIKTGNQQLLAALFHPENATIVKSIIGLDQFYIQGEPDRKLQHFEIKELLTQQTSEDPQVDPIMQRVVGPTMKPSVAVSDSDNHAIHIEIIKIWRTSEEGQWNKINNPQGYDNVIAHEKQHQMFMVPPEMPGGIPGQQNGPENNSEGPKPGMPVGQPGGSQPPSQGV